MNKNVIVPMLVAMFCSMLAGVAIGRFFAPASTPVVMMVPGMDQPTVPVSKKTVSASTISTTFRSGTGQPSTLPGTWPQFRGSHRDNICTDYIALSTTWPPQGPTRLWELSLGEGHSGAAVAAGRVYVLDYDELQKRDVLRCLSLDTGQEIWQRSYPDSLKRNHGFSRTVPAISGKYVVTIGPKCHVMCVDAQTGDLYWLIDLEAKFGTTVPLWYTGQCPLIFEDQVILGIGGTQVLLAGLDLATGKTIWQTPNPEQWQMSHSSVMVMPYHGQKMFVYCSLGGILGVWCYGPKRGQVAWKTTAWNPQVIAPSPVFLPRDQIFVTAGYGSGSMLLQLQSDFLSANDDPETVCPCETALANFQKNNASTADHSTPDNTNHSTSNMPDVTQANITPKILQTIPVGEGLSCEQQTPLLYQGHLFGILPKDAGERRGQLICYRADNPTQIVWASGKTERFGLGPFFISDNKIIVLNDDGVLSIIEASTREYRLLARASVLQGRDAWAPMALVSGRLILRDSQRMICLDLRAKPEDVK